MKEQYSEYEIRYIQIHTINLNVSQNKIAINGKFHLKKIYFSKSKYLRLKSYWPILVLRSIYVIFFIALFYTLITIYL